MIIFSQQRILGNLLGLAAQSCLKYYKSAVLKTVKKPLKMALSPLGRGNIRIAARTNQNTLRQTVRIDGLLT